MNIEQPQSAIDRLKREGLAVPTIPEALESEEDMTYLAIEIGKILQGRPEDKKELLAGLEAAETYLGLDTDGLDYKEMLRVIGESAIGSSIGALIVIALAGTSSPVLGGVVAGNVAIAAVSANNRRVQKRNARDRISRLRGLLGATT